MACQIEGARGMPQVYVMRALFGEYLERIEA